MSLFWSYCWEHPNWQAIVFSVENATNLWLQKLRSRCDPETWGISRSWPTARPHPGSLERRNRPRVVVNHQAILRRVVLSIPIWSQNIDTELTWWDISKNEVQNIANPIAILYVITTYNYNIANGCIWMYLVYCTVSSCHCFVPKTYIIQWPLVWDQHHGTKPTIFGPLNYIILNHEFWGGKFKFKTAQVNHSKAPLWQAQFASPPGASSDCHSPGPSV